MALEAGEFLGAEVLGGYGELETPDVLGDVVAARQLLQCGVASWAFADEYPEEDGREMSVEALVHEAEWRE